MDLMHILINGLHLVATVVWIGAIFIHLIVVLPGTREALAQNPPAYAATIRSLGTRMVRLVNSAILLIIGTGIYLVLLPDASPIETVSWEILLPVKIIVVAVMVAIHLCRTRLIAPRIGRLTAGGENEVSNRKLGTWQLRLAWVNCVLGLCLLFLSPAI